MDSEDSLKLLIKIFKHENNQLYMVYGISLFEMSCSLELYVWTSCNVDFLYS